MLRSGAWGAEKGSTLLFGAAAGAAGVGLGSARRRRQARALLAWVVVHADTAGAGLQASRQCVSLQRVWAPGLRQGRHKAPASAAHLPASSSPLVPCVARVCAVCCSCFCPAPATTHQARTPSYTRTRPQLLALLCGRRAHAKAPSLHTQAHTTSSSSWHRSTPSHLSSALPSRKTPTNPRPLSAGKPLSLQTCPCAVWGPRGAPPAVAPHGRAGRCPTPSARQREKRSGPALANSRRAASPGGCGVMLTGPNAALAPAAAQRRLPVWWRRARHVSVLAVTAVSAGRRLTNNPAPVSRVPAVLPLYGLPLLTALRCLPFLAALALPSRAPPPARAAGGAAAVLDAPQSMHPPVRGPAVPPFRATTGPCKLLALQWLRLLAASWCAVRAGGRGGQRGATHTPRNLRPCSVTCAQLLSAGASSELSDLCTLQLGLMYQMLASTGAWVACRTPRPVRDTCFCGT